MIPHLPRMVKSTQRYDPAELTLVRYAKGKGGKKEAEGAAGNKCEAKHAPHPVYMKAWPPPE